VGAPQFLTAMVLDMLEVNKCIKSGSSGSVLRDMLAAFVLENEDPATVRATICTFHHWAMLWGSVSTHPGT
jgi:hypothetical protein